MKYLSVFLVLICASVVNAQQSFADRLTALEQGGNAMLSRMATVESKIDALSVKVDKLSAPVASVVYASTPATFTDVNGVTWSYAVGTGSCASSVSTSSCGSSSGSTSRGLFRRRLRGSQSSSGCGG